jgi:hypothetical protein
MLTKITTRHMGLNLELDGLDRVNYLVGVNGAGKTRFFDSLQLRTDLYIKQSQGENLERKIPINFYVADDEEYCVAVHGSLANHRFELDPYMVKGEKGMDTPLGVKFQEHPFTQKILNFFRLGANFEFQMHHENNRSYAQFRDNNNPAKPWRYLKDSAGGIQSLFKLWAITFHLQSIKGPGLYLLGFDEGDRHLHPTLAKKLPSLLDELIENFEELMRTNSNGLASAKVQIFVATHSPFTVRGALEHESHKIFHIEEGALKCSFDRTELIKKSGVPFDEVLADLGFKMQDLYYPETLICVEGPVDALYLQFWLEKFLEEMKLSKDTFIKGVHYDFFEFGGALAAHPTLSSNVDIDLEEVMDKESIVNLFSLNRKVFLMVDNDANNAFEKTKTRLQDLIDKEKHRGCIFFRNEKYTTIECLLTESTKHSENKSSKVSAAVANLKYWRKNSKSLSDFNPEVYTLMHALYGFLSEAVYSSAEPKTQASIQK